MIGTAVVILDKQNRVLLGKRLNKKAGYGKYAVPGGKVEDTENVWEAIIRETFEETGLQLDEFSIEELPSTHAVGDQMITKWFLCTTFYGVLENREPEKCEDWLWFDLNNLPENLWLGTGKTLELINERVFNV